MSCSDRVLVSMTANSYNAREMDSKKRDPDRLALGQRLREIRQRTRSEATGRALSAEAVAERIGVAQTTVSSWETGKSMPDLDDVVALARLYGCSIDYLVQADDHKEPTYLRNEVIVEAQMNSEDADGDEWRAGVPFWRLSKELKVCTQSERDAMISQLEKQQEALEARKDSDEDKRGESD